ncbi:hypothetical protein [Clostridium botulinum]|uniref:hypothetical protein n=1 Tax=Clostridium botulinum TaxID=1491 RepID=UPI001C9BAE4D|nr:hypothetical protein [Clostridium botulinum]MBY6918173.1 hypothetical protein [Clostridium botulinum]
MKKYEVMVTYGKTGRTVKYTYEGDGEYMGQTETVEQRIERHFNKKAISLYTMKEI